MSSDSLKSISDRAIVGGLAFVVVGLIVYIFTTTVSAQNVTNDKQDAAIATAQANIQELTKSNLLLTQIVQEDHDALKGLKSATGIR